MCLQRMLREPSHGGMSSPFRQRMSRDLLDPSFEHEGLHEAYVAVQLYFANVKQRRHNDRSTQSENVACGLDCDDFALLRYN